MGYREKWMEAEGTSFPGKTYAEVVLEPAFNEAKTHLLGPMMAINKAHLIMLQRQQLVSLDEAKRIASAIRAIDTEALRQASYTGQFEDLFFQVEHQLLEHAGEIAGNLHLARSRNDMGIAIYRMVLREKLLVTLASALKLKEQLLLFASDHTGTLMIGYTHTQQAQPTTLAHYMMAVADSLNRDIRRMMASYANCNRSSMGAAALTTSGFAISREQMMELLAFDELIDNSYDAIGGADYLGEIATAVQLAAINLGRVVQDMLLWCTQEFGALHVAAPYVQISSIMPQKRNPVSFEHMRALLSSCVGNTNTVLTMIHNTPFGDIVDTEDDMQPYAWKSLGMMDSIYRLFAAVIGTMDVNKEVLRQRTQGSFATVTELADTLVRTDGLSFRKAHHIVSDVVRQALAQGMAADQITLSLVNESARRHIGRDTTLSEETLGEALDPAHFVDIRSLPGGPSPKEVKRMIGIRMNEQQAHVKWVGQAQDKIRRAMRHLDEVILEWSGT
ncbi:argininosuccinate lyase [Paenibacillus melissococcoides]|uniref:Argininosuccinate lyase n=1 Tax=Paenibacillus melissococcoides TaxID=2912268 RepID=A0ABN8U5M4_9BACL|nr:MULTISPECIES: argininosuccinate lyase [Paenibacillus]MEB9895654.1 argininosuccinate lyase [Bacillus cereus]CAH8246279.1 argininosuccinate lyase [Paenibacillus melissococcoides]CAH8713491.1 argininosuccinate lyase [Paenibacillus melissococcoides]CAH8714226.1 argininosuccinate lyase [Paenibacillus melissococcoides]GIO80899.1 argininosuccinate lyase [Paenibacillus dendritiformis]